jgi:hypothetical protein
MFCPGCGIEERSANQFCRACGADLRRVRTAIESPDQITASAISARDEIGRAIATKMGDLRGAGEWSTFAEEVLPEIEKFLESPEEKRLRRLRAGMMLSSIGLGTALGVAVISAFIVMKDFDFLFLISLGGIVCFFIGLGIILNGLLFTVPKKALADRSSDADSQRRLDLDSDTNELQLPSQSANFASVTEHTTKHLKEKQRR